MKEAQLIGTLKALKNENHQLNLQIEDLRGHIDTQHKTINNLLTLMKNYDARLSALQEILQDKGMTDAKSFDVVVDAKLNLRTKMADEKIAKGDVAWVDYRATLEGEKTVYEDILPVRVGSGAVMFEDALIGKTMQDSPIDYHGVYADGPHKGKKIFFKLIVQKVKTALHPEEDEQLVQEKAHELKSATEVEGEVGDGGRGDAKPSGDAGGVVQRGAQHS